MEEFESEDILLIPAAKLAVRSKTIQAIDLQEQLSIGGRRANMILNRLVELGILQEVAELFESKISNVFSLGNFIKASQNEIDEFLEILQGGNPNDFDVNDYGLDFEFDYHFEKSCETPFIGSILSYYLIKSCYWQKKTHLNVMIHMLEKGSEVNQVINLSGSCTYLIEHLLDLMKKAQNIESRASAFEVIQQYIFATKGAGKYDEIIEEYEDRLMLNAKK